MLMQSAIVALQVESHGTSVIVGTRQSRADDEKILDVDFDRAPEIVGDTLRRIDFLGWN